jgi:hypothetical protein
MKQKPGRRRTSRAVRNPSDEIILLEDLAPLGDVKGGMIVFGFEELPHPTTPRATVDDTRVRHPPEP